MAQKSCEGCRRILDASATVCPECGRPSPIGGFFPKTALGWIFVVIVGVIALSCFLKVPGDGAATPPPPGASRTSPPGAMPETPSPAPATTAVQPVPPSAQWRYADSYDEMRQESTHTACLTSANELQFEFPYAGGSTASICFRQSLSAGFDAWLDIERGQFMCGMGCTLRVKFDDGQVQAMAGAGASDGTATMVFFRNAIRFLSGTRAARRVVIEADFYQAGSRQMVFENVSGLAWETPRRR